MKLDYERAGVGWPTSSGAIRRLIFACRDGYAALLQGGGGSVRMVNASQSLVDWMSESNMAPGWLKAFDWENDYDSDTLSQDTVDRIEALHRALPPHEDQARDLRGGMAAGNHDRPGQHHAGHRNGRPAHRARLLAGTRTRRAGRVDDLLRSVRET